MVRLVPTEKTVGHRLFHVVFICTGNRARSALAEAFLRARVGDAVVRVESYGTLELGPAPAMPEAIIAASALGIDIHAHRARSLRGVRLDDADLVIGFEPFHVATAVVEAGAPRKRTFTLHELAVLLGDVGPADDAGASGSKALVARADARRSSQPRSSLSLADPYGKSKRVYAEVARTIDALTATLAARLFGSVGGER